MTALLLPSPDLTIGQGDLRYTWEPITASAMGEMKARKRWKSHMCFEGMRTPDRREFAPGSLNSRPLPLPLMALETLTLGHFMARLCGRIDKIERQEGGVIYGEGVYADTEYGAHIEELVDGQMLRWNSVDTQPSNWERIEDGEDPDGWERYATRFLQADLIGMTLVPFPAFPRAVIVNEGMDLPSAQEAASLSSIPLSGPMPVSITASAGPTDLPPAELFADPHFDRPTHVAVRDVPGTPWRQFSGHLADWAIPHIGVRGQKVYAPRSRTNYAYYRSGATPVAGGDAVRTGVLSLGGGHCEDLALVDPSARRRHYDSTSTGAADLAAGEDQHGPWLSGVLRRETTFEQARVMHAGDVSGDWTPIPGVGKELVAVLCVNVAGFPVAEPILAAANVVDLPTPRFRQGYRMGQDGEPEELAMVAAGMLHNDPHGNALLQLRRQVAEMQALTEPLRGLALRELAEKLTA